MAEATSLQKNCDADRYKGHAHAHSNIVIGHTRTPELSFYLISEKSFVTRLTMSLA